MFFLFHRSEPEAQIIAYKTQQYKLLPGLAMAYATKFTFDHVWRSFQEMQKQVAAGEFSMLPEVSLWKSSEMSCEGNFFAFNEFLTNMFLVISSLRPS